MPALLYHWDFRNATSQTILDKVNDTEVMVEENGSGTAAYSFESNGVHLDNPDWDTSSNPRGVYIDLSGLEGGSGWATGKMTFEIVVDIDSLDRGVSQNKFIVFDLASSTDSIVFKQMRGSGDLEVHRKKDGSDLGRFRGQDAFNTSAGFQHFMVTLSGTKIQVYKDGSVMTHAYGHAPTENVEFNTSVDVFTTCTMGGYHSPESFFPGTFKYFKIYSGAMTAAEVLAQYDSGNCLLDREFVDATIYQGVYDWIDDPIAHALIHGSIEDWDTSKVESMNNLFKHGATVSSRGTLNSTGFDSNISDWDTSKVSTMSSMFEGASIFDQAINTSGSKWKTTLVTDMSNMFSGAAVFNKNISDWTVTSVTNMSSMFNDASGFNQDISNWDVSSVVYMNNMFNGSAAFNQDISGGIWDTTSVTNYTNMFSGAAAMIANHSAEATPKACYFLNSGCVCFLGSEKVRADQGLIRFDKLTTNNTINGYKITKITKMTNSDDHLIYIKRDALGINVPNKDTYISRNHGIILSNHIIRAKTLENGESIIKAYRSADTIYNVLTEEQTIMRVNNIPCETLNPDDPEVKKYL